MPKKVSGLWGWLARRFSAPRHIVVVLDRRRHDRRQRVTPVAEERRREDRRRPQRDDLGEVTCLLGEGTRFVGELSFRGAFRVDGHLEGRRVSGDVLIVGDRARVSADVQVEVLQVGGQLRGNVTATRWTELLESSRVTGTIRTPRLTIWNGALFNGTCEMPSAKSDGTAATPAPPSP